MVRFFFNERTKFFFLLSLVDKQTNKGKSLHWYSSQTIVFKQIKQKNCTNKRRCLGVEIKHTYFTNKQTEANKAEGPVANIFQSIQGIKWTNRQTRKRRTSKQTTNNHGIKQSERNKSRTHKQTIKQTWASKLPDISNISKHCC